MQNKKIPIIIVLLVVVIAILAYIAFVKPKNENNNFQIPVGDTANEKDNESSYQIEGNKEDLVSFSIQPGQGVSGIIEATGSVRNAYFFEANIGVNILDANKKLLRQGNGMATTDWMTVEPVSFETTLDFTGLPKGLAYIEIHNDNPSGMPQYDKSILIPIIIE